MSWPVAGRDVHLERPCVPRAVRVVTPRRPSQLRSVVDDADRVGPAARRQSLRTPLRPSRHTTARVKILSLTAGAASMYCGSCLRDNALAAELIRQGHDVTLLPFYTPTLTDEENVSRQEQIFFGGISVYLEQHMSWFRSSRLLDRLLDSPSVIKAFTSGSIAVDPKQLGAMTVSTLKGEAGHQRKEIDKLIEFVSFGAAPDVVNIPYTLLICL